MLKLYIYAACSTCRNAMQWLDESNIRYQPIPIRETPPPVEEIDALLTAYNDSLGSISNSSGIDFRAQGMKDKLAALPRAEALALLATNGNFLRRPIAIDVKKGIHLCGFREPRWKETFKK